MGVDQAVVFGVLIVILMVLLVSVFDFAEPLLLRGQFDEVCRQYVLCAEAGNGLKPAEIEDLRQALEALNIQSISFEGSQMTTVERGKFYTFRVSGTYEMHKRTALFTRTSVPVELVFERQFLARRVIP